MSSEDTIKYLEDRKNYLEEYRNSLIEEINYLDSKITNVEKKYKTPAIISLTTLPASIISYIISSFYYKNDENICFAFILLPLFSSLYVPRYIIDSNIKHKEEKRRIEYKNELIKKVIEELINNKEKNNLDILDIEDELDVYKKVRKNA